MANDETGGHGDVHRTNIISMRPLSRETGVLENGAVLISLPMDFIRSAQVINQLALLGFVPVDGYELNVIEQSMIDTTADQA